MLEYESEKIVKFLEIEVKKTIKFLRTSINGFYCSICDAKSHEFFNIKDKKI